VQHDHPNAEHRRHGERKVHEGGEGHHRHADRPDDLHQAEEAVVEVEPRPDADDGEFQDDQPQAACQQEARELRARGAARTLQVRGDASQEHKDRRTEVGDPARQKQERRRLCEVGGIET
jgi:hypothetical protein